MIALALVACGPDLPAGWEDAVPVSDLDQAECAGSAYDTGYPETAEADFGDPIAVAYRNARFRCAQDVEAFARDGGDRLDLLVQPIDMHPRAVAGCDCLYDITMTTPFDDARMSTVGVWRRWDDWNDPNDPLLVAELTAPSD